MKTNHLSLNVNNATTRIIRRFVLIVFFALLVMNYVIVKASDPVIKITKVPPLGESGYVEGKVVWNELTAKNINQYAVIAMLHAIWDGGGDYFVKPFTNNYLNNIDLKGSFRIMITTGGMDNEVDEVFFYLVDRSTINDADVANPATMSNKYLATKTIYRSQFIESDPEPEFQNINNHLLLTGTAALLLIFGCILTYLLIRKRHQTKKKSETSIEIAMDNKEGLARIPVRFNGVELFCIVDTGAEISVISTMETNYLVKYGKLKKDDFGEKKTIILAATNEEFDGRVVNFKTLEIGTQAFNDVKAFYTEERNAEPILGNDVLSRFGKVIIDNEHHKVIFEI